MGDRGYNAGGWAYMPRVWCGRCGWSFLTANRNRDYFGGTKDHPLFDCRNRKKCQERQDRKSARPHKSGS